MHRSVVALLCALTTASAFAPAPSTRLPRVAVSAGRRAPEAGDVRNSLNVAAVAAAMALGAPLSAAAAAPGWVAPTIDILDPCLIAIQFIMRERGVRLRAVCDPPHARARDVGSCA